MCMPSNLKINICRALNKLCACRESGTPKTEAVLWCVYKSYCVLTEVNKALEEECIGSVSSDLVGRDEFRFGRM